MRLGLTTHYLPITTRDLRIHPPVTSLPPDAASAVADGHPIWNSSLIEAVEDFQVRVMVKILRTGGNQGETRPDGVEKSR